MLVAGIDGGGGTLRLRVVDAQGVVFESRAGGGNPNLYGDATLEAHLRSLLQGAPPPDVLAACVSGAGILEARRRFEEILAAHLPTTRLVVRPDYEAAFSAIRPSPTAVVIAGTGSVVCSRPDGRIYAVSGGLGWQLGDDGSATLLGQRLVRSVLNLDPGVDDVLAATTLDLYGVESLAAMAAALRAADNAGTMFARAAPLLTARADSGDDWGRDHVDASMAPLAWTTTSHLSRHHTGEAHVVALVGRVWESRWCRSSFERHLAGFGSGAKVRDFHEVEPAAGAVEIAKEFAHDY